MLTGNRKFEVVSAAAARARLTPTNLLIIADVLIVHRGFAQEQPKIVQGLVQGLLEGNRLMRDKPDQNIDVVARAFKWNRDKAKQELAKVHLSNLPENLAFFSGAIDAAGSFCGIYQSAVLAYGSDVIKDPPDPSRFADTAALQTLEKGGLFKEQTVAIAPIRTTSGASSRPIRCSAGHPVPVRPNSRRSIRQTRTPNLEAIKRLRGHSGIDAAAIAGTSQRPVSLPQAGAKLRPDPRCARWIEQTRAENRTLLSTASPSTPNGRHVRRGW